MAEDLVNSDQVAMKIESPLAKKPVLKLEITVLRKVQESPFFTRFLGCGRFLPPVKDAGSELIHSYMVMDLLGTRSVFFDDLQKNARLSHTHANGNSLADLRKKSPDGKLSLKLSATVAKQMVRGIQALHKQGILHRDIKPGMSTARKLIY